jgi:uroporphyrin-III C-methyltransferase/precorrin-2 dehydrogenase/sirohydrochlorin ferrochelatase
VNAPLRHPLTTTRPPRIDSLARLPVFFALAGKRVVVAGSNAAAAWKAELLTAAGAQVDVYSAEPCDELLAIVNNPPRGPVTITGRAWRAGDFPGATLAVGAFDNDEAAAEFAEAARAAGVLVNMIDKPAFCDFSFGAIVNRSPLVIGISTDGAAPVFAQAIRAKLESLLPQGFSQWAAAAARWRGAVKASGLSFADRRKFWQLFTAHAVTHPQQTPSQDAFQSFLADVKGLGRSTDNGSVTLVGAGPGDPELLTLRAVRALQSADVILFDSSVSRDVLDFARRESKRILVGNTAHGPSGKPDDIQALTIKFARQGQRVVRLKGCDPLNLASASEEVAAYRAAGLAVEIVPGVTAQGAASQPNLRRIDRKTA